MTHGRDISSEQLARDKRIVAKDMTLLVVGGSLHEAEVLSQSLEAQADILRATDLEDAIEILGHHSVSGLCLLGQQAADPQLAALLLEGPAVLSQFPEGLAVLDTELRILWRNSRFEKLTKPGTTSLADNQFYEAFGMPEIVGPEFSPFHAALGTRQMAYTRLHLNNKFLSLRVTPVFLRETELPKLLLVMVRDITASILEQQKVRAVHEAGQLLSDLSTQAIKEMSFEERIEYLKARIIAETRKVLHFENLEIRLIEPATGRLISLLVVGMRPDAAVRELFARPEGNGVTGYVAFKGESYLIPDVSADPLYLPGAEGAKSSLTVPLIWHDRVLGTFNVESTFLNAFGQQDCQFLELFAVEVAHAINLLELLKAQNAETANTSILRVLREVARPIEEVLNELAFLTYQLNDQGTDVADRLRLIGRHTGDIKQLIQNVREQLAPEADGTNNSQNVARPILKGKHILVVDSEDYIRRLAFDILTKQGCIVETAGTGAVALR
ncbi:MAG: Two-component system response regulator, partial [Planctomycetaceae bacterium]|nr:Two-component system response regulator [Planctomycetaceae bacterium]